MTEQTPDLRARLEEDDERLKPCPFCGGEAETVEVEEPSNVGGYVVQCLKCEASTRVWFPIKDSVDRILRDAWNQRAALTAGGAEPSQGWQPIESAPKDGRWILLHMANGQVWKASWGRDRQNELHWCHRQALAGGLRCDALDALYKSTRRGGRRSGAGALLLLCGGAITGDDVNGDSRPGRAWPSWPLLGAMPGSHTGVSDGPLHAEAGTHGTAHMGHTVRTTGRI